MTILLFNDPELVIAVKQLILFVNTNDLKIFKEIKLPTDLTKCTFPLLNNVNNDDYFSELSDVEGEKGNFNAELPCIDCVQIAPNNELLSVTTSGQKALLIYRLILNDAKLASVRMLKRASTSMTFTADSKALLIADKAGDCYIYDCETFDAKSKLLLGNLCTIYDVLWSRDKKFIITGDRDGKIRVCHYPAVYDIQCYCLGHEEFVSTLGFLTDDILMSISGDKTLRFWNFIDGKELIKLNLPGSGIKFTWRSVDDNKNEIAILCDTNEMRNIVLYEIGYHEDKNDCLFFKFKENIYMTKLVCCNICFTCDSLYVVGVSDGEFRVAIVAKCEEAPIKWLKMVSESFKEFQCEVEDYSKRFRKKFDNISDYLERKKRRIENKKKYM